MIGRAKPVKCPRCQKRRVVSAQAGACEVCLYAEVVGDEAAERQIALAEAARAARKPSARAGR